MNDVKKILERIKEGKASWLDFKIFLNLKKENLEPFLDHAWYLTRKNFPNKLKIYIPNKKFPAISITGNECALDCAHCDKKYLNGMKPIQNAGDLEDFLTNLSNEGGKGALISGGCESDGSVPLIDYLDAIKKVKKSTKLIINTHTGLLNEATAQKLAEAAVDIVSFDINMDNEIIKEIYHLEKTLDDYIAALRLLQKFKLNVVPHICIGLYYGNLHKELDALKVIKDLGINPSLIVLIALITPKNSEVIFKQLSPEDIAKVIATTRFVFPETEISLGCMRPRGGVKVNVEKYAIKAGITRIEIPSKNTLQWLREFNPEINFKFYSACCAIPVELEKIAESEDSDIKRYLNI